MVKEYVSWARGYVEFADPLPYFFDSIEKDQRVYYHDFSKRRFGP